LGGGREFICLIKWLDLKYLKSSPLLAIYIEQYSRIHHQKANLNGQGQVKGSEQCSWLITVNDNGLFCLIRTMVQVLLPAGK